MGAAGGRLQADGTADRSFEVRLRAQWALETGGRDLDAVTVEVRAKNVCHALAERMVDPLWMVDVDAEAFLAGELEREHFHAGQRALDLARDLSLELSLPLVLSRCHCV